MAGVLFIAGKKLNATISTVLTGKGGKRVFITMNIIGNKKHLPQIYSGFSTTKTAQMIVQAAKRNHWLMQSFSDGFGSAMRKHMLKHQEFTKRITNQKMQTLLLAA